MSPFHAILTPLIKVHPALQAAYFFWEALRGGFLLRLWSTFFCLHILLKRGGVYFDLGGIHVEDSRTSENACQTGRFPPPFNRSFIGALLQVAEIDTYKKSSSLPPLDGRAR